MIKTQLFRLMNVVVIAAMASVASAQISSETIEEIRTKAEQGHAAAQYALGLAYDFGEGVAKDTREAVRWYRQAAEQGVVKAQSRLGLAYVLGEGVAKDTREAVWWFYQAAEQGDADAQYSLGVANWHGEGIPKDKREAVRWFHQAAEQGDADAQHRLGLAYWHGEGVIEDEYEAYIWYSLSKANGDEKAAENLRTKKWHNYLSKTEIRAAKKEAARRLKAIDRRQEEVTEEPAIRDNIAIAAAPKGVTVAAKVFENAWRSVVVVVNGEGQGSGVIIRPNIVATNCHVVNEGGGIEVYKSVDRRADTDSAFPATIRHMDEDRDFCLLDVVGLWGVSATVRRYDTLAVGEDVYGLGAPQGLDLSFSSGLVSQLRTIDDIRYIQTNAAISPGSSGGGLFDNEGNLVGIMTFKIADESTEGIGFAIPADLALAY